MVPEPEQLERLAVVRRAAALRWRTDPVLVPSHSNDTWLIDEPSRGPAVLRIAWRGDRGRLITEAKVGRALPREVGYPTVLGFGWSRDEADLTWLLTRRLFGLPLAQAWPELSGAQRAEACATVTGMVRRLHGWRPSAAVSDRLLTRPRCVTASEVVGAMLLPLPQPRARSLLTAARFLPGVDPALLTRAAKWLGEHQHLAPAVDRPGVAVTHQDLHLGNVWWDGHHVSALLDLEWTRFAEPWIDLHRVLDNAAEDRCQGRDGHDQLLASLRGAVVSAGDERLRFCRVLFQLRQLFVWPPPLGDVAERHPVRVLAELLS